MKVIILTPEMRTGGTCRDAVEWANRLSASGAEVIVVAKSTEREGLRRLAREVSFVSLGDGRSLWAAGRLLEFLRRHPTASILANSGTLAGLAIAFRRLGLIRQKVVFVDPFNPADTFRRDCKTASIYRWMLWRADAFVHLSAFAERYHLRLGLSKERSHRIPNISAGCLSPQAPRGLASPLRFVAVGRLDAIKGFDRLIRAFGRIAGRWPGATLRIVGEGYDRPRLEQIIAETGLVGAVELAGHSDDVPAELRAADVFILPSLYEGMPNALIEALGSGLRVVTSPCRGSVGSLMRSIGAAQMIVSEDDFGGDFPRAVESALSLGEQEWAAVHRRFRDIFDDERNFGALRSLLSP